MDETAARDNAASVIVAPGGGGAEKESNADSVCQTTSQEVEDVTSATSAPAGTIRPIDRGVVHQICSGQVCYDLGAWLALRLLNQH